MLQLSYLSWAGVALLTSGLATGAIVTSIPPSQMATAPNTPTPNQTTAFPDTADHWAQPFIENLAERDIVTGYLDGTFRPERPVDRDEFAAILRDAFSQQTERQIAGGSVYKDVPKEYWAAPAIEEAYQMGFMQGYPGGYFRPQQGVTRVEALVALAQNLNLDDADAAATPTQPQAVAAAPAAAVAQPTSRRARRRTLAYPVGMTMLMQPFVTPRAAAVVDPPPRSAPAAAALNQSNPTPQQPVSTLVSEYYTDADQIPQYAVDEVANATKAGLVVNHPNPRVLNPTEPATRGEIAAFIYQALVEQGKAQPINSQTQAANYIVRAQ